MRPFYRHGRVLALVLVALVAACDDDNGTEPGPRYDPQETLDRLDAVLDPLDVGNPVLDGLWLASDHVWLFGASPAAEAIRFSADALSRHATRSGDLRALATRPGAGTQARRAIAAAPRPQLAFPGVLRGETLVWDPAQGYVIDPEATGAPANGVRFIYYETDAEGFPSTPLAPVGSIDFTDEDRTLAERIGVQVVEYGASSAQDREVADYFIEMSVAGTSSAGSLEFDAQGTVAGRSGEVGLDVIQQFTWSQAEDYDRLVMDQRFDTDAGPVLILIRAEMEFEGAEWETMDFETRIGAGAEEVEITVGLDPFDGLDGEIRQGGTPVIDIAGTDGAPVFTARGGRSLTSGEVLALERIWTAISDIISLTQWLMVPGDLLVLEG